MLVNIQWSLKLGSVRAGPEPFTPFIVDHVFFESVFEQPIFTLDPNQDNISTFRPNVILEETGYKHNTPLRVVFVHRITAYTERFHFVGWNIHNVRKCNKISFVFRRFDAICPSPCLDYSRQWIPPARIHYCGNYFVQT